jgi:Ca2+/Na+ antiporter
MTISKELLRRIIIFNLIAMITSVIMLQYGYISVLNTVLTITILALVTLLIVSFSQILKDE